MKEGRIFNIQRFSIHDGPGIRTTVFFKGCNLRCYWCHNPESWKSERELRIVRQFCIGCRRCIAACPNGCHHGGDDGFTFDRASCVACGRCFDACPTGTLTLEGYDIGTEELLAEIEKDSAFFENSGGGVTFSGGECMLQADFLSGVLKRCREKGFHTAVDTAGNVPFDRFAAVAPYADLFLYDVKCIDESLHIKGTGASNARILDNLQRLSAAGANLLIRVPLIGGFNDGAAEMTAIGDFLRSLPTVPPVQLMPYHAFGEGKKESLGLPVHDLKAEIMPDTLQACKAILRGRGLTVIE